MSKEKFRALFDMNILLSKEQAICEHRDFKPATGMKFRERHAVNRTAHKVKVRTSSNLYSDWLLRGEGTGERFQMAGDWLKVIILDHPRKLTNIFYDYQGQPPEIISVKFRLCS